MISSASTARPEGLPDVGDCSAWPGLQSDFQPSHGEPNGSGNHAGWEHRKRVQHGRLRVIPDKDQPKIGFAALKDPV